METESRPVVAKGRRWVRENESGCQRLWGDEHVLKPTVLTAARLWKY